MDKGNAAVKKIVALFIFGVAFAVVEAAVVVYLREIYYPGGFDVNMNSELVHFVGRDLRIEMVREVATMFMLLSVAYLSFEKVRQRVWAFVLAFSVWDFFYYVFLFLFIRWPASLSTLDVYFLIPVPWIGPVWIPLVIFIFLGGLSVWKLSRE